MNSIYTLLLSFLLTLTTTVSRAQVLTGTFAAGATHSLAIHDDGSLWATGDNARGQLGTGTTASQLAWVQVGTANNWVRVAAGAQHSLALQANGTLWAWGDNTYGQLGTATNSGTGFVAAPMQVPGTYTQLAAGQAHSLALQANGTLWAWGDNFYGQLGTSTNTGTHTANPTPAQVGTTSYTQLAAGSDFDLALRPDGTLWAWGRNTSGQLGNSTGIGTDDATPTPTQVGTDLYTQLAAGQQHSLALRPNGSLWAWGNNFYGQLGNPTNMGANAANPAPLQVAGTYTRLAAGLGHSLALQADGSLYAWGDNAAGQLGTGSSTPSAIPALVSGTYVQLAAGASHGLALRANGSLWAWGSNASGQLGGGSTSPAATPAATGTALPTRSTALGSSFGLAVRADGTLWAWGDNTGGQLGTGTTTGRTRPVQIGTDNDWVQVAAGTSFSLALKANGTVWAWGLNNFGQLGSTINSGTTVASTTPAQVGTGVYTRIAAGAFHGLALAPDGSLYAWGNNTYGQLGNGTSSLPSAANPGLALVSGSYTQVAAGISHTVALRADGSLYAWGINDRGQLGISQNFGSGNANSLPVRATAGTYAAVATGAYHTLALAADGTLATWGSNSDGQLGNLPRSTASAFTASLVAGIYNQVAAGALHSLALRADGTLWAWGNNTSGQLGLGNASTVNAPTQEATRATSWVTLANSSAGNFSLVRTPSGLTFASAGQNSSGQLGDGTTTAYSRFDRLIPLSNAPQTLPVQLVSFQARRTGATTVALSWVTATEITNAGFGIERSADGVSFSRLDFVAGAGSSRTSHSYTFPDNAALSAAYYRLAQTDINGTITFSPVQFVGAEKEATHLLLVPNPASGPVQALGLPTGATLAVYDALGRLVRPAAAALDVAGLAAGVYVVRAQAPGQPAQAARLLVQ
jgi:alpha-tubulin suppressor-like RCC1 family protein